MKSTVENLLLWEQRIKEKAQAGMKVEEWCKKNGMSKYQYYYWNRRVHQKQKPEDEIPFPEITPLVSNTNNGNQNTVQITN